MCIQGHYVVNQYLFVDFISVIQILHRGSITLFFIASCFPLVQHERMKFLCIGTQTGVEVYAWAQKPYSKFMAFKVGKWSLDSHFKSDLQQRVESVCLL